MKILFDANLPHSLATAVNAIAENKGLGATSIFELYGTTKVKDEIWLSEIGKNNIIGVITQDYFDKSPQEIAAYQKVEVPFFYLAKAYNNYDLWKKSSFLFIKWPVICRFATDSKGYAEFEIPSDRGSQLKQLRRKRK